MISFRRCSKEMNDIEKIKEKNITSYVIRIYLIFL